MKKCVLLPLLAAVVSLRGMEEQKKKLALSVGTFAYQNFRDHQEDRHTIEGIVGVFDGHANAIVSEYLEKKFPEHFKAAQGTTIKDKLKAACKDANDKILEKLGPVTKDKKEYGGSTAVIACVDVKNSKLYFANVGDSRGILGRKGTVIRQTKDHKPTDKDEENRINQAGGYVFNFRLNSKLLTSRAFGDPDVGKGLIAEPDIYKEDLQEGDDIILVSDGVTDCLSSEEIANLVNDAYKGGNKRFEEELDKSSRQGHEKQSYIAELVIRNALEAFPAAHKTNPRLYRDNMTVVIGKWGSPEKVNADKKFYADKSVPRKDPPAKEKPQHTFFKSAIYSLLSSIKKIGWVKGIGALALIGGLAYYLGYLR